MSAYADPAASGRWPMSLLDWQFDGHKLLPWRSPDGDLGFAFDCPDTGPGLPLCRVAEVDGGVSRPPLTGHDCALDVVLGDDLHETADPAFPVLTVITGLWVEICWRVNSDGDGVVWAPARWAMSRQVAV